MSSTPLPIRSEAHLVVAAIRVLEHLHRHPPTDAEIAALLKRHEELVRVTTRALLRMGVIVPIESPHDVRYQITDYGRIEDLEPDVDVAADFTREMDSFEAQRRNEAEKMEELFDPEAMERRRREKMDSLDKEFGKFKGDKPLNPFGDD